MAIRISGDGAVRAQFAERLSKESFLPTMRAAVRYPDGTKLPFFYVDREKAVKFDARAHPARGGDAAEVSAVQVDPEGGDQGPTADDDYEVITLGQPRRKAYAPVAINGRRQICCFDSGGRPPEL